jgi:hypothetical protein
MLDLRQADARPQGPTAWDAWDGAHRDATVDALRRPVRPGQRRVDGAERLAGRVRDVRERHALRRRWELQAALAAELEAPAAPGLCTRVADQFAARSCAARAAAEQPAWPRPAARQLVWKLQRALVEPQPKQLERPSRAQQESAVARKQAPIQPATTQAALLAELGDTRAVLAPEALQFSARAA